MELVKAEEPEYATVADSFNILTNVIDSNLNVFITTNYKDIIDLGILFSDFLDRLLGSKTEAKVDIKHSFTLEINKFLTKDDSYTFYHAMTKDVKSKISWKLLFMKETAKKLLKANEAFNELKYEPTEPFSLIIIGLLHLEVFEGSFKFDNADFEVAELETKM